MQDHMIPVKLKGKQMVFNKETRKLLKVADIKIPSFNEMDSILACSFVNKYGNGTNI